MEGYSVFGAIPVVKWIYAYVTKPKLRLYIDQKKTYDDVPIANANNKKGYFIHVMVENIGYKNSKAKNCRGRLIKVEQQNSDGKYYPHPTFRVPEILHWSNKVKDGRIDWDPINIDTETPARLDVANTINGSGILYFFTPDKDVPHGNQTDFPAGSYRIRIRVEGDNVEAQSKYFLLRWGGGNYKDLTIKDR